jgi:predicted nucleic acid-binding protein
MSVVIVDTGPLVAYLDRSDRDHNWAKETLMEITQPLLTCEVVIAEALFLLRRGGIEADGLLNMIKRGLLLPEFRLSEEIGAIQQLMKTYRNIPMSLADACLVRMAEVHESSKVMTLDSDFVVYRKSRRKVIPLLYPRC